MRPFLKLPHLPHLRESCPPLAHLPIAPVLISANFYLVFQRFLVFSPFFPHFATFSLPIFVFHSLSVFPLPAPAPYFTFSQYHFSLSFSRFIFFLSFFIYIFCPGVSFWRTFRSKFSFSANLFPRQCYVPNLIFAKYIALLS